MGCLRLFLAMCVVVSHAPLFGTLRLIRGEVAVELFFMISGFYMALVLDGKYGSKSWHQVSSFYLARYLRLWPTFLVTTLASYALWLLQYMVLGRPPTSAGPVLEWAGPWFAAAVRFSNTFMIGQDVFSWFHISEASGAQLTFGPSHTLPDGSLWAGAYAVEIGPAWSIGTEIWFYICAPYLMRARSAALIALAVAGLTWRYYMESALHLNAYFFYPAQLPMFLAGCLGYRALRENLIQRHKPLALFLTAAIAIFTLCAAVLGELPSWSKWILYGCAALGLPSLFTLTRNSERDRAVGELSYPIYMVHMLVISVAGLALNRVHIPVTGEIVLLLTLPIAYGLFRFVERPVDKWRQALTERRNQHESAGHAVTADT